MFTKLLLSLAILNPAGNAVTIKNLSEYSAPRFQKNLEEIITDKNLGLIKDPSKVAINNKLEQKYNIDSTQVELTNLTYSGVRVKAKVESKDYFGSKYINFDSQITNLNGGKTRNLRADAYNSNQYDSDSFTIKYTPVFGREAFTDYFKSVNFQWRAKTRDNGPKSKGGDKYHNAYYREGKNDETIGFSSMSYYILADSIYSQELYSRTYKNVNSMSSSGSFYYSWIKNTFTLSFKVNTHCYATAWNAQWARAENQLEIKNVYFSR